MDFDGGQSAGIFAIETFGTFLFARRYIRDVFTFKYMVKCLVLMVLFLMPFAAYENLTGSPVLIELFEKIFIVFPHWPSESRFGLSRAAVTFEHPILFGVVCSSAFALSYYTATCLAGRLASSLVVVVATFTSLSSGPVLSLVIQAMLIVWDTVTKSLSRRWIILAILAIVTYFVIDFLSNRHPVVVITSYLAFSADNAHIRVLIWRYGTQSVMQHPMFGIGLNEWERPAWLGDSIDNFWLVNAVRYGIPGFFFLTSSFISVCFGLGQIRNLPFQVAQYRKGLIITLCGLAAVGGTVHFWNVTYVLFIFLLGSGMWIFEHRNRAAATSNTLNNPSVMRNPAQGGRGSPTEGGQQSDDCGRGGGRVGESAWIDRDRDCGGGRSRGKRC